MKTSDSAYLRCHFTPLLLCVIAIHAPVDINFQKTHSHIKNQVAAFMFLEPVFHHRWNWRCTSPLFCLPRFTPPVQTSRIKKLQSLKEADRQCLVTGGYVWWHCFYFCGFAKQKEKAHMVEAEQASFHSVPSILTGRESLANKCIPNGLIQSIHWGTLFSLIHTSHWW